MMSTLFPGRPSNASTIVTDTSPDAVRPELALARAVAAEDPTALFVAPIAPRSVLALAQNTRRAYRADWCTFVEFCRNAGFHSLPATPAAVEAFIEWRSPEQEKLVVDNAYRFLRAGDARNPLSAAALARALSAISAVHRWLKYPDPTYDEDVIATLQLNTAGRRVQKQKDPLRWEQIEAGIAAMGDDLRATRNKAMIAVAHSTMLRRAELVACLREDYRRVAGDAHGRMLVTRTKTADSDEETFRHVAPEAVIYLERWIERARIESGPLFRGISPSGKPHPKAMDAAQVARIFKDVARLAGVIDVDRIGGHSTRIGATQDLKLSGADTLDIMQEGGWESHKMPKRYLRGLNSDTGAMARMARARQRK